MATKLDLSQILQDLENTSTLDELSVVAFRLRDRLKIEHLTSGESRLKFDWGCELGS